MKILIIFTFSQCFPLKMFNAHYSNILQYTHIIYLHIYMYTIITVIAFFLYSTFKIKFVFVQLINYWEEKISY